MDIDRMYYRVRHPLRAFNNWHWNKVGFPPKLKYYYQRIKYGICDTDSWNLDSYITTTVRRGMIALRDGSGHPCIIWDEDGQEMYVHRHKYDGQEPELSKDEYYANSHHGIITWNRVLDDIIEGMEEADKFRDGWYEDGKYTYYRLGTPEYAAAESKIHRARMLLVNNWESFWD